MRSEGQTRNQDSHLAFTSSLSIRARCPGRSELKQRLNHAPAFISQIPSLNKSNCPSVSLSSSLEERDGAERAVPNHNPRTSTNAEEYELCQLLQTLKLARADKKLIHLLQIAPIKSSTTTNHSNSRTVAIRRVNRSDPTNSQSPDRALMLDDQLDSELHISRKDVPKASQAVNRTSLSWRRPESASSCATTQSYVEVQKPRKAPSIDSVTSKNTFSNLDGAFKPAATQHSDTIRQRTPKLAPLDTRRGEAAAYQQMLRKLKAKPKPEISVNLATKSSNDIGKQYKYPTVKTWNRRKDGSDSGYGSASTDACFTTQCLADVKTQKKEEQKSSLFNPKAREFLSAASNFPGQQNRNKAYPQEQGRCPTAYPVLPSFGLDDAQAYRTILDYAFSRFPLPAQPVSSFPGVVQESPIHPLKAYTKVHPFMGVCPPPILAQKPLSQMHLSPFTGHGWVPSAWTSAAPSIQTQSLHPSGPLYHAMQTPTQPSSQSRQPRAVAKPVVPHTGNQQAYEEWIEWRKAHEPGYAMECKRRQERRAGRSATKGSSQDEVCKIASTKEKPDGGTKITTSTKRETQTDNGVGETKSQASQTVWVST